MKKHIENVLYRYVIATLESTTRYLIFKDNKITFTNNITRCTKTASRATAEEIRSEFYAYTGMADINLVVIPLRITYELIQEEESVIEGDNYGAISG